MKLSVFLGKTIYVCGFSDGLTTADCQPRARRWSCLLELFTGLFEVIILTFLLIVLDNS